MTDNIDRIQEKITSATSIALLAADILRLKDTIDTLYRLTVEMGYAICVNLEALKEIVEVLAANDFCADTVSVENSEFDLRERFDVWCDVTKHLQQAFVNHQESTKIDLNIQRNQWATQKQINQNLLVEIDKCKAQGEAYALKHKELQETMKELIVAIKTEVKN